MVVYEFYGTNRKGVELTRAYSDEGYLIEREGVKYEEAVDPADLHREYTETDEKIPEEEEEPDE